MMELSSSLEDRTPLSESTMSKLDSSCQSWSLKVETTVTPWRFSVSNSTKKIQTMLSQEVGITTSWFGILDNNLQSDPFMGHTSVEIQLIFMTDISSQELTQIPNNCSCGTLVLVNQLKTFLGMKDYHQRRHARSMELNSRRALETSLLQEEVAPTKSKFSMAITCSNHALKSKISVELLSLLTLAIKVTCSHAEVVMVSSEYSTLLTNLDFKHILGISLL